MASYYTSQKLIDAVKRKAYIPIEQQTQLTDDILAFADEETLIGVVPAILKMHQEFYVYPVLVPLEENVLSYPMPNRAIGEKVRNISYIDAGGNRLEMARCNPDDLAFLGNRSAGVSPRGFYFENDNIILLPGTLPNPEGFLEVKIFIRPNQLVIDEKTATVESIDRDTGVIIVNAVPEDFSVSNEFDFIERIRGHKCKAINVIPGAINLGLRMMTFSPSSIPTNLVKGDLICIAGETSIPQMPDDLHALLAQRTTCRILEAQKDTEGLKNAYEKLKEMEVNLGILIDNRSTGNPEKVNNIRGLLRNGKFNRRGRW